MNNFFDAYMQEHNRLATEFQTLHSQLKQTISRFNEENRRALETLEKMKKNQSSGFPVVNQRKQFGEKG